MSQETNETIIELLGEMRDWLKVGFRSQVKQALRELLSDSKRYKAYTMTDGSNSVEVIRKACGMSPNTVLKFWTEAEQMGLIRQQSGGKRVAVFNPESLGLSQPTDEAKND